MGTIHKLKPEIRDFIIEEKKSNLTLSCRKLTLLILEHFNIKTSKSSINIVIKEAGLSAPVGRTLKRKKRHITMPSLPVLLECFPKEENGIDVDVNAEEKRRLEEEATKRVEEERRLQEAKIIEEERIKIEAESARKLEEEATKKAAEERRLQEIKKSEEEARLKEEERLKVEAELARRFKEEAAKRAQEEEKLKAEAELARRLEEEATKKTREDLLSQAVRESAEENERKFIAAIKVDRFSRIENTGILLLKAADSIIGGSKLISEIIKDKTNQDGFGVAQKVENLLYLPLIQDKMDVAVLSGLNVYADGLDNLKVFDLDVLKNISTASQEVRCVKIVYSDGESMYLDGQMYSVWPSTHIPYGFACPLYSIKNKIERYLNQDSELVLFNAPGYDSLSADFFDFLAAIEAKSRRVVSFIFYNNKLEKLATLSVPESKKRCVIFGVWAWQFSGSRRVKNIGEFRKLRIEEQNRELCIADIEIELLNPEAGKQIVLNGCALKATLSDKTRIVVLSNLSSDLRTSEELAKLYLNQWPNLEEAFQDYSRKIELFTYMANAGTLSPTENLKLPLEHILSTKDLLKNYLTTLDAYVRTHFLPAGYESKDFLTMRERFYSLSLKIEKINDKHCLANFILPPDYIFKQDLNYALRRINESEIVLSEGLNLYLKLG